MPREGRWYPGPTAQAAVSATRTSAVMVRMSVALRRSRSDRPRGRGLGSTSQQAALAQRADHREEQRDRSEEHTSELQSPCNLVCRLLLEKKKRTRPVWH